MNWLKTLWAVNKVKSQLTQIFKMVKSLTHKMDELERRQKLIAEDVTKLFEDTYPNKIHDTRYESLDERIAITEAFINNLEKIELFDKDIAN